MSTPNQIAIDSTNNTVTVQTDENLLLITKVSYNTQITPPASNQIAVEANPVSIDIQTSDKSIFTYNETPIVEVDVIQPITKVIQVAAIGAQGPVGPVGPVGPIGPPGVITAASGLIVTGSIFVSGSPGSVTAISFTGSLFGTASWATNALTASFLPVNTYQITSSWAISASQALTASYVNAQNVVGLNLSRISTGSITASVNVNNDTFRIQSGSSAYFFISSSGRVGIGTTTPTAKLQVVGSVLISGSSTLTNIGPAVFSGSIDVTQGNVTLQESLYVIKKVSIGTTQQSASLTISASSTEDAVIVKLNDGNGSIDKFTINNEGIAVLGALNTPPTPVAGGIYFSSNNDYFFGFS